MQTFAAIDPHGSIVPVSTTSPAPADDAAVSAAPDPTKARLVERHLALGWWGLFGFAGLGVVLEALQGLRIGWYLDVSNEARRLMFTLAHAHGTLLSLVNLAFAFTLESRLGPRLANPALASTLLLAAWILLPVGFLAGGVVIYDGDPGLGVLLVPIGAVLLIYACALVARHTTLR